MNRSLSVLPLVLISLAAYVPPTFAEETAPTQGYWLTIAPAMAMRQKAGASLGVMEEDKDVDDNGGTTTFTVSKMEVKSKADRGDGESPKTASGRALILARYDWIDGSGNNPPPPDQYFRVDLTTGWDCYATPLRDNNLPADQRAGEASGTGKGGTANNSSVPSMEANGEQKEIGKIFDTMSNGQVNRGFAVGFAQSASASVSSMSYQESQPGGKGSPPLPPVIRYTDKACSAEGRTYGKSSAAYPYRPAH